MTRVERPAIVLSIGSFVGSDYARAEGVRMVVHKVLRSRRDSRPSKLSRADLTGGREDLDRAEHRCELLDVELKKREAPANKGRWRVNSSCNNGRVDHGSGTWSEE